MLNYIFFPKGLNYFQGKPFQMKAIESRPEAYAEPYQTFKMECFAKRR